MQGMLPPRRMRFSLESRCRIVRLIVERQWSPEAAAAACGAQSVRRGIGCLARYRAAVVGRGCVTGRRRRRRQPRRLSAAAESEIVAHAVRRQRWARWSSRRSPGGRLRRSGRCCAGVAARGCHGLSAIRCAATSASRPGELLHVDTKKLGSLPCRSAKRILHGRRAIATGRAAGSTCTSRSTITLAWPTPKSWPGRTSRPAPRSCRRAVAWYAEPGDRGRTRPVRQRQGLPLPSLARHLRRARDRTPLHAALHAPH